MFKRYIHAHDNEITAEKSYSYSKHYLILNKDRMIISQIPCADVEGSKSWVELEETDNKVSQDEMVFTISSKQVMKYNKWRKKIEKKKPQNYGAAGGGYSFSFTPTGLGDIVKVRRDDGEELDLSDIENW